MLSNAPNADVRMPPVVPFQRRLSPSWNQVPCQPLNVSETQVPSGRTQMSCVAPGVSPGSEKNRTDQCPTGEAAIAASAPAKNNAAVSTALRRVLIELAPVVTGARAGRGTVRAEDLSDVDVSTFFFRYRWARRRHSVG